MTEYYLVDSLLLSPYQIGVTLALMHFILMLLLFSKGAMNDVVVVVAWCDVKVDLLIVEY